MPSVVLYGGERMMPENKPPTLHGEIAAGVRQALGTIPEDLLGIAVGDWLREKRIRNQARLKTRTAEILTERGVSPDKDVASPVVFIAVCEAALDEDRVELQELWARLLAAASDPDRATRVRASFVDIIKQLDPLDAVVLKKLDSEPKQPNRNEGNDIAAEMGVPTDEVRVSLLNLGRLNLIGARHGEQVEGGSVYLAAIGRELLRLMY
jgi:Abortive infection alpha